VATNPARTITHRRRYDMPPSLLLQRVCCREAAPLLAQIPTRLQWKEMTFGTGAGLPGRETSTAGSGFPDPAVVFRSGRSRPVGYLLTEPAT